MPRIDNTSKKVIKEFKLKFDPNDPGDTPPIDLCATCFGGWEDYEIDHPPYQYHDYADYTCFWCKAPLTKEDN